MVGFVWCGSFVVFVCFDNFLGHSLMFILGQGVEK